MGREWQQEGVEAGTSCAHVTKSHRIVDQAGPTTCELGHTKVNFTFTLKCWVNTAQTVLVQTSLTSIITLFKLLYLSVKKVGKKLGEKLGVIPPLAQLD